MKAKEILLDFTPLLDVALILLFFFLLFSTFEIEEAKAQLEEQVKIVEEQEAAAEARMDQADAKYAEAEVLVNQLEEALEIVRNSDSRRASNTEALIDFNRSMNIKILLAVEVGNASVTVVHGEEILGTTTPNGDLAGIICSALQAANHDKDDTILCEFIYDGSQPGTTAAYRKIHEKLMYVKGTYHYFYYSETDMSVGKD